MTQTATVQQTDIRPFRVSFSAEEVADLRRRVKATKWPERETVNDASQGVQFATTQKLARYWSTDYDWSKCEARLKALPHFITNIDGLDIHFIHVKSKHPNALPIIVTHGWPGSVIEQLKIIDPLTNPTAHGGSASDAFDIVIPSLPGYGFTAKTTAPGWDVPRISRAWITLMKRLGYTRFVAQGGDWGNAVSEVMGLIAPPELLAISTNMAATVPPEISKAMAAGGPPPADLTPDELYAWKQLDFFYKKGLGYANEMGLRPQTLYALADFTRRPRSVDPRPRLPELRSHRPRFRRSIGRTDARRHPGQHHVLLADEHCCVVRALVLGVGADAFAQRLFRRQRSQDPGFRHRLPARDLRGAADLGNTRVPKSHLLQATRQGHALRGVGATRVVDGRLARELPVVPVIETAETKRTDLQRYDLRRLEPPSAVSACRSRDPRTSIYPSRSAASRMATSCPTVPPLTPTPATRWPSRLSGAPPPIAQ